MITPDDFEAAVSGMTSRAPDAQPTDGIYNFTAAIGIGVPVRSAGRYVVQVIPSGEVVRELPFVVNVAAQV